MGRVVTDAQVRQEVRRQEQGFRITCWCPNPATRDAAAGAIDQSLSGQRFISLPDGTSGRLTYAGNTVFDQSQNARLYRRDLTYNVEYATVISRTQPSMLFGNLVLNTAPSLPDNWSYHGHASGRGEAVRRPHPRRHHH